MTNLDRHEWEFSRDEKYAIRWLKEHGFSVTLNRRYVSVDHFTVSRDGVTDQFSLPLGDPKIDYRRYMEQYGRNFDLLCELERLRRQFRSSDQEEQPP